VVAQTLVCATDPRVVIRNELRNLSVVLIARKANHREIPRANSRPSE
jgi:hypothetical protein